MDLQPNAKGFRPFGQDLDVNSWSYPISKPWNPKRLVWLKHRERRRKQLKKTTEMGLHILQWTTFEVLIEVKKSFKAKKKKRDSWDSSPVKVLFSWSSQNILYFAVKSPKQ